jgi:L-iditol 2-dehydrogenase
VRIATYYNNHDVRLEEFPTPQIGHGEMLMRVEASGVCGTDVMEWYRVPRAPRVLGHEVAGQIVAVGEGVTRYREGARIMATHHVPCNTCPSCLRGRHTVCETLRRTSFDPGGFAEYIRLPAINVDRGVFELSETVSYEEGSFVEPLGCALRGLRQAGMQPGMSVLVIGSGMAGLLFVQLCRALGAGLVVATDIVDFRIEAARRLGADVALHARDAAADDLRGINGGRLADLVITCTGAPAAVQQALESVDPGGTVLLFAPTPPPMKTPLDLQQLWTDGVTLTTSYGASPADLGQALALIQGRRVQLTEMITHRLGLADTGRGFQLVAEARDSLKVMIQPQR